MKLKKTKPKVEKPVEAPVVERPSVEDRVNSEYDEVLDKIGRLQNEATLLEGQLQMIQEKEVKKAVEQIFAMSRDQFDQRERNILKNVFDLLSSQLIWETLFIPGVLKNSNEVEHLYKQGYRYLGSAFDDNKKTGGCLYHRPKPMKSAEEFMQVYDRFVTERNAPKVEAKPKQEPEKQAKKKLVIPKAKAKK